MEHQLQPVFAEYEITDTARKYLGNSLSINTRLAYQSDFNIYLNWCRMKNKAPLPGTPAMIVEFISDQASGHLTDIDDETGLLVDGKKIKPVSIARRVAALAYAHKANGYTQSPTDNSVVRKVLQGIQRTEYSKPNKKKPIAVSLLSNLIEQIDTDTPAGIRDKAFMLIGFACAMRRSELVNLRVEDIEKTDQGLLIDIPLSKTDQEGKGQSVAVLPGNSLCPIKALNDWLTLSGITSGYIFRRCYKNNIINPKDKPMTAAYISKIIKKYAEKAGENKYKLSGHSLRRGFITSAAQRGANIFKIMSVSRHKSVETVKGYIEDIEKFNNHASEGLL
jgi:integrase